MISKNLYVQLLVRVFILIALSLVLGWMIFQKEMYMLSLIPIIAIIIQTVNLVRFLNATNRRLFYFFDADAVFASDGSFELERQCGNAFGETSEFRDVFGVMHIDYRANVQ